MLFEEERDFADVLLPEFPRLAVRPGDELLALDVLDDLRVDWAEEADFPRVLIFLFEDEEAVLLFLLPDEADLRDDAPLLADAARDVDLRLLELRVVDPV